jgi:hypothetical protein
VRGARTIAFRVCQLLAACPSILLIHPNSAAQQPGAASADAPPPILLPWLAPATSRPLALSFSHEIEYDPAGPSLDVKRSRWEIERLRMAIFDGRVSMVGRGEIGGGRPSDVATTLTLERVDAQRVLRFLQLPRSNEIEARIGGRLYVRILAGDWDDVRVSLETEPGTVRLSRGLIRQMLGGSLDPQTIVERVDPTLNYHFGSAQMIPIESMRIEGSLGSSQLILKIPIRNAALNMDFEPRIDKPLLWEMWGYLKNAGLRDVQSVDWGID